jgi:hypothetical protein
MGFAIDIPPSHDYVSARFYRRQKALPEQARRPKALTAQGLGAV